MKKVISSVGVLALAFASYWYVDSAKDKTPEQELGGHAALSSKENLASSALTKPEESINAMPATAAGIPVTDSEELAAEDNPYLDQALKAQFRQIADLYEQASKYPHFSQPLYARDQIDVAEPFERTAVDTPFPVDGLDKPIRLNVALDKFQYLVGEPMLIRVDVEDYPAGAAISATATVASNDSDTGLVDIPLSSSASDSRLQGLIDSSLLPAEEWSPEMLLKVSVSVNEHDLFSTVGFRISEAVADLVSVPFSEVDGPYLSLPLQFDVHSPGYYFVHAVLQDAESQEPLVKLQTEGRMESGFGLLHLRAHIQALKERGSEGPYSLTHFEIYRGAEDGEEFDLPASLAQSSFDVEGASFDQYDDVPYQNAENQERLEFLKEVGSL